MKGIILLLFFLVLALAPIKPVNAPQVLQDSYDSANNDGDELLGSAFNLAAGQSFTPKDTADITEARFLLKKTGSPTGTIYARLYTLGTGSYGDTSIPGNLLVTSNGFDVSTLTTTYTMTSFSFSTAQIMNGEARYFIVIDFTGIGDPTALGAAGIDVSSPSHNGNMAENQAGNWNSFSSQDMVFEVYGNVKTEPIGQGTSPPSSDQPLTDQPPILPVAGGSTLVLIGLGVIAYFGLRGRKRGVPF